MTLLSTPGVYIEPRDPAPEIGDAGDDVAAFIGFAERGPLNTPVACRSMRQFHSHFGNYLAKACLAYAVRAFFENGGRICLVVRVASAETAPARTKVLLGGGRYGLAVEALTSGAWGNRIEVRVAPRVLAQVRAAVNGNRRKTPVPSVQGFEPRSLARLRQGGVEEWAIVAAVDADSSVLHWLHPQAGQRKADEASLSAIDPGLPFTIEAVSYDLVVLRDQVPIGLRRRLSPVPGHSLDMAELLSRTTAERTIPPFPVIGEIVEAPTWAGVAGADDSAATVTPEGGVDGLRHLTPEDMIAGIETLEASEPAILACPDAVSRPEVLEFDRLPPLDPCRPCATPALADPPSLAGDDDLPPGFDDSGILQVQQAMIGQCERLRERVALIDPPLPTQARGAGLARVLAWRRNFDSSFAALHHPWLAVPDPMGRRGTRTVPPCGHVAGQLAAATIESGAHRAAAGRVLAWADAPALALDEAGRGILNDGGVDTIGVHRGGGLRILGARSMTSDPAWRMFPVRRLVCAMRRALERDTRWAVFEPNNDETRLQLFDQLDRYLALHWRRGALAGSSAAEAYRLRCDESNNDDDTRANGRLRADLAIAPAHPLEFIVLRIGREGNSFEVEEDGGNLRAVVGKAA